MHLHIRCTRHDSAEISPNLACTDAAELGSVFLPNRASAFREVQFDADAIGIVTENLYPGRFRYVEELRRLGADITNDGHHAVVRGRPHLDGAPVTAPDIRAGAALVIAGLIADGETPIADIHHIDRGYDDLAGRLGELGADIERAVLARAVKWHCEDSVLRRGNTTVVF